MNFKQPYKPNEFPKNLPKPMKGVDSVKGITLFYYQHSTPNALYEFWYDKYGDLYHFRTTEKDSE